MRFSAAGGIAQEQRIPLEDFQVHGMKCRDSEVELAAFSLRYLVDLSVAGRPRVRTEGALLEAERTPQTNLGNWSHEGVIDLEADGPVGEFQLVITRASRRVAGGVEHYTVTQLIRRDATLRGRILAAQKLFEGIFLETIDIGGVRR